jgi:hypothetical protein
MSKQKNTTYQLMTDSLNAIDKKNEVSKLIEISSVESFNEEIQAILLAFYHHEKSYFKRLGTVFNAAFTQQNSVFTFSLGLAQSLIPLDKVHGLGRPDDKAYNSMIHHGLSGGLFEKIREQVGNKAALYRITHPKILLELELLMGKEARLAKENKFIEWWDSTNPDEKRTERILTDEEKKAREIADGIFKRK